MNKKITVFTPTYNRKKYLVKAYHSLVNQSSHDFIWQVVDDGSDDGTEAMMKEWIAEGLIDIDYHWKENGGKASAINYSLNITNTDYWVCLDSDDYLFENAVRCIIDTAAEIEMDEKICGIFCVRSNKNGEPMTGMDVPSSLNTATQGCIRFKHNINPEYVQIYKTSVIKKYRFPEIIGEKFVTESWLQDQIDVYYQFKVIHEPIMVCEYLEEGYTKNYYKLIKNNPIGFIKFYSQRIKIVPYFKARLIAAIFYNAVFGLLKDKGFKRERSFLIYITIIPGLILRLIKLK